MPALPALRLLTKRVLPSPCPASRKSAVERRNVVAAEMSRTANAPPEPASAILAPSRRTTKMLPSPILSKSAAGRPSVAAVETRRIANVLLELAFATPAQNLRRLPVPARRLEELST